MNEYTISKIQIYKADPDRWIPEILKVVSKDQLPVRFGGTLTDPDGDERLTTKICQGGKISKDLYSKNLDKDKINEDFTTAIIKKGGKFKIDMIPDKVGSILSWEFRSEDHDIKFGIIKKNNTGEKIEIIPIHRVAAHQIDEVGVITCEEPATCKLKKKTCLFICLFLIYNDVIYGFFLDSVVFDNSYSLLRNKKIHYNVRIEEPNDGLQELALHDN